MTSLFSFSRGFSLFSTIILLSSTVFLSSCTMFTDKKSQDTKAPEPSAIVAPPANVTPAPALSAIPPEAKPRAMTARSAKFCATAAEKKALDTRVLQTELMVAALSCNEKENYRQFVTQFQPELKSQSAVLQSYFARTYKAKGPYQLNLFVTKLANGVSQRNAHIRPSAYCAASKELFAATLLQNKASLMTISSQERFTAQYDIAVCTEKKNTKPLMQTARK